MAYTDSLTCDIEVKVKPKITTTDGLIEGEKSAVHKIVKALTDGSGSLQATGFFSERFTATTGGITVSLADSADPLAGAGDDVPTSDPEGTKLRLILVENEDSTNYVTVGQGANGEASVLSGSTDTIRVDPGGFVLWFSPAGNNAMNDGSDDELVVTADTASCNVVLTYIFG